MLDWLFENKEWLFSGIGVAILSVFAGWVIRRRFISKQKGRAKLKIIDIKAEKLSQTIARLDIKMMNSGDTVAFTKELNVKTQRLHYHLPIVRPSGKYDLEITNDDRNALNISHKIKPNDVDRIILDVSFIKEYWYWSLLLKVEITYNDDQVAISDRVEICVF